MNFSNSQIYKDIQYTRQSQLTVKKKDNLGYLCVFNSSKNDQKKKKMKKNVSFIEFDVLISEQHRPRF